MISSKYIAERGVQYIVKTVKVMLLRRGFGAINCFDDDLLAYIHI